MSGFYTDYKAPGILREVAQWMNSVGAFLNGLQVVGNGHIQWNPGRGSATIHVGEGDGGAGGAADYSSFFKVYDASAGGSCKIGVKDGSAVDPLVGQCGFVWANGEVVGVDAYESAAIESAGSIWVWLVTQIGPTGASSSVMTTTDSTAPSGYGYATQSQLLGRVTIASSGSGVAVAAINQDYLKGGEHMAVFFSDCALLEDEG